MEMVAFDEWDKGRHSPQWSVCRSVDTFTIQVTTVLGKRRCDAPCAEYTL